MFHIIGLEFSLTMLKSSLQSVFSDWFFHECIKKSGRGHQPCPHAPETEPEPSRRMQKTLCKTGQGSPLSVIPSNALPPLNRLESACVSPLEWDLNDLLHLSGVIWYALRQTGQSTLHQPVLKSPSAIAAALERISCRGNRQIVIIWFWLYQNHKHPRGTGHSREGWNNFCNVILLKVIKTINLYCIRVL